MASTAAARIPSQDRLQIGGREFWTNRRANSSDNFADMLPPESRHKQAKALPLGVTALAAAAAGVCLTLWICAPTRITHLTSGRICLLMRVASHLRSA
jgi:hypothetical protein